ncbi:MAG: VOC family protein [Myxococcota bacterium]|nr:VOC family protein [Myxococcota bacterium]
MTTLNLLVLACSDIEATRAFYECAGLSAKQEQHGRGPVHYAIDAGQTLLELYPATSPLTDTTTRLGLQVTDMADTLARLEKAGYLSDRTPSRGDGGRVIVTDPDGRTVYLTSSE